MHVTIQAGRYQAVDLDVDAYVSRNGFRPGDRRPVGVYYCYFVRATPWHYVGNLNGDQLREIVQWAVKKRFGVETKYVVILNIKRQNMNGVPSCDQDQMLLEVLLTNDTGYFALCEYVQNGFYTNELNAMFQLRNEGGLGSSESVLVKRTRRGIEL